MQGSLMLFPEFLSVGPHCPAAHPDPILAALPPERPRTWGPGSGGAGLQAQTELASHGRQPRGLRALPPGPHSLLARCGTLLTQAVGPAEGSHGLTPSSALGQGSETLSSQRSRGKLLTSSWLAGRVSVGSQGEGHKGQLVGEGAAPSGLASVGPGLPSPYPAPGAIMPPHLLLLSVPWALTLAGRVATATPGFPAVDSPRLARVPRAAPGRAARGPAASLPGPCPAHVAEGALTSGRAGWWPTGRAEV